MTISGVINLNKPTGITSYGVIEKLKKITGEKRLGHAGTLDPIATGVLPIAFGWATRVLPFLHSTSKTYQASVRLGIATDSYDRTGTITHQGDISNITEEILRELSSHFKGDIKQKPPLFSALSVAGKRYYELARSSSSFEPPEREVRVSKLHIIKYDPPYVTLEIVCGKGTYVRSIANDMGEALGCGACVWELVRLNYGPYPIERSSSIEEVQEAKINSSLESILLPAESALQHLPKIILDDQKVKMMGMGQLLESTCDDNDSECSDYFVAFSEELQFVGILKKRERFLKPYRVFLNQSQKARSDA